jgi:hypothetical protein
MAVAQPQTQISGTLTPAALSAIASCASQASLATVRGTWSGVRPHLGGQGAKRRPVRLSLAHQYDQDPHLPGGFGPMGGSGGLPCTFSSQKPGSSQVSRSRPHHDTPQLPPGTTVTSHHAPARPAHGRHPPPRASQTRAPPAPQTPATDHASTRPDGHRGPDNQPASRPGVGGRRAGIFPSTRAHMPRSPKHLHGSSL